MLRSVFGKMLLVTIEPQHIYVYHDKRGARTAAKREIEVLSHAYTKAVEWGYIKRHPFKGQVRLENNKPRSRYVEDWEIIECLSLHSRRNKGSVRVIQAYIRLKLLTGLRKGDMLRITQDNLKDDGIYIKTSKTKKPVIYEWTNELENTIKMIKEARPIDISRYLFCTSKGKCYISDDCSASDWNSMWKRFMTRVIEETKVKKRFTEHDLRAKVASDADSLEHARALLTHTDARTTNRTYRRKAERVVPLSYTEKIDFE